MNRAVLLDPPPFMIPEVCSGTDNQQMLLNEPDAREMIEWCILISTTALARVTRSVLPFTQMLSASREQRKEIVLTP